ncbi:ankyrin repeat domain-containing protein [Streptomyces virginiae]|uniref:ankyrin repeat domain-containing protein n=1 Tax=Streptomyces virginiae TaxID=1961 RepID=UPI0036E5BE04
MAAVRGGDAQAVDALPAAGADPDTEDEDGTPALRLAVEAFDHPIVEALLQASAGTERADSAGRTPLLRAIELGARDIVESLITHGARLWVTDARGRDALEPARYWYGRDLVAELHRATGLQGPVVRRTVPTDSEAWISEELSLGGLAFRTGHAAILTGLEWRHGIVTSFDELLSRAPAEPDVDHEVWWETTAALHQHHAHHHRTVWDAAAALRHRPDPRERRFGAEVIRGGIPRPSPQPWNVRGTRTRRFAGPHATSWSSRPRTTGRPRTHSPPASPTRTRTCAWRQPHGRRCGTIREATRSCVNSTPRTRTPLTAGCCTTCTGIGGAVDPWSGGATVDAVARGRRRGSFMLDEAMVALAASVGSGVVQAAGTDAWQVMRNRLARVFGRGDRQQEAVQLERLDRTAAELTAAGQDGDEPEGNEPAANGSEERARHGAAWRTRTEDLLDQLDPDARAAVAAEFRALLAAAAAARPTAGGTTRNTYFGPTAVQSGDGNVQVNRFDPRP